MNIINLISEIEYKVSDNLSYIFKTNRVEIYNCYGLLYQGNVHTSSYPLTSNPGGTYTNDNKQIEYCFHVNLYRNGYNPEKLDNKIQLCFYLIMNNPDNGYDPEILSLQIFKPTKLTDYA